MAKKVKVLSAGQTLVVCVTGGWGQIQFSAKAVVHKRCSGVKGAFVRVVESFHCRRCLRGISQAPLKAGMTGDIEKVNGWMKFKELSASVMW